MPGVAASLARFRDEIHMCEMANATCGKCGATFDEAAGSKAEDRKPCPVCGSTTRRIFASANIAGEATVSVSASVISGNVQSITAVSDLLLQAVIVPGARTNEGTLIEAVALPWFDIIEFLKTDPSIAFQLPWEKWEEIIAGAYKKAGFEEVTLTPRSGDHGRDVIAIKKGICSIRVIDQVKAYKPPHRVDANDVRALMGVLQADGASKGCLTTTSDFAPMIKTDPLIVPFIPSRLELVNGTELLARLEELAKKTKP
jgi:restriction system protein